MTRWVIVARMTMEAHVPDVYGTWETEDAAKAQMEAWERRIERTTDENGYYPNVLMSVEPMSKSAASFARDFQMRTGQDLK